MATRGKPASRSGTKRATAASTKRAAATRASDTESQGLVPMVTSAPTEPAPPAESQAVAAATRTGKTKLSGLQIEKVLTNLSKVVGKVVQSPQPAVPLPPKLLGTLVQPDASPASDLQIEVVSLAASGDEATDVTKVSGSQVLAAGFTDAEANFSILLPRGVVLQPGAALSLRVRGADPAAVVDLTVAPDLLGPFGYIGTTRLPKQLPPTPAAILAQLRGAIGQNADEAGGTPALPKLALGDCPDCIRVMENQTSFERFPYGIFFQLIAPTLYAETETVGRNQTGVFNNVIRSDAQIARVDLNGPISIDEFRDSLLNSADHRGLARAGLRAAVQPELEVRGPGVG